MYVNRWTGSLFPRAISLVLGNCDSLTAGHSKISEVSILHRFFGARSKRWHGLARGCVYGDRMSGTRALGLSRADHRFSDSRRCLYGTVNAVGQNPYILRQLFEHNSFTYTYLIACKETQEAALIDPVYEMVGRDEKLIQQLGLRLKYAINTHVHADHITGSGKLKEIFKDCKSILSCKAGAKADMYVSQGDKVSIGNIKLEVRCTPGHTDGCTTYVWHEAGVAFTGDTILFRGCGRTDFQQGSAERLYESILSQIYTLPDHFVIYAAHDYTGQPMTTVGEEKRFNPRLTKSKEDFIKLMNNLNLPYPKQIDRALPANMKCGIFEEAELKPRV